MLASRREPFELLFTAHARAASARDATAASHIEDAVVVFDQWQSRTLLDEMAQPSPDPSLGLSSTVAKIQSLGRWLPVASKAPLMTSDGRAALQTLRGIDLVALAVAEGTVWRLTALRGRLRLDSLGSYANFSDQLDRFVAKPTDPALAGSSAR